MKPLAYTTSVMSWRLLLSAIQRIRGSENGLKQIDLNLEAPSCAILCCIALEAFVNEISSLTNAFLFNEKKDQRARCANATEKDTKIGMPWDNCQDIAQINNNPKGSFYDRYKALLKAANIEKPNCMLKLSYLRDLRNAFVHFRMCDIPIVEDSDKVIRYSQEPPKVFAHLKLYKIKGWPVIAEGSHAVEWTLRVSTNAMAAWSLILTLEAILHILDLLPIGKYRDFILRRYAITDLSFNNVFEKGKKDVDEWKNDLFLAS